MRRYIENQRIVLLDYPLEYESQTNVDIAGNQEDFNKLLQIEEQYVAKVCADIIAVRPDAVFTEKGVYNLAQHFLLKAGITAIRRLRKTLNLITALPVLRFYTVVYRTEELTEKDVRTGAGLSEIKKMGDEYFCFVTQCADPKASTSLLPGVSSTKRYPFSRTLCMWHEI